MSAAALHALLVAALLGPPAEPAADAPAPDGGDTAVTEAPVDAPAPGDSTDPATDDDATTDTAAPPAAADDEAVEPPTLPPPTVDEDDSGSDASTGDAAPEGPGYTVVQGKPGPPFSTLDEQARLRERYGLPDMKLEGPEPAPFKRKFRCFLADPSCGFNVEINATSAYAYRVRQGDVSVQGDLSQWSSGRAQYDLWINFAAATDVVGQRRYTRITLGPKGGVAVSDSDDLWGNVGLAMRAFLTRGSWAPTIELTTAMSFQLRGQKGPAEDRNVGPVRSPVGLTADLGFGVGGLGSVIFGGQFDPPLAREDLPERVRVSTSGMFFVGFRGNILWGVPAASAVATHAVVQRTVTSP